MYSSQLKNLLRTADCSNYYTAIAVPTFLII
jgi:hypothetical protein